MKHTLLLFMMLALGMYSINASAQTKKAVRKTTTQSKSTPKDSREYQVGDDGFEWYKVCKNGKYGAEDKRGNLLVSFEYDYIRYQPLQKVVDFTKGPGFEVKMGNYYGFFNGNGKCIIPFSRKYTKIAKYNISNSDRNLGTFYYCETKDRFDLCDINGNIVKEYNRNTPYGIIQYGIPSFEHGKMYFQIWTKDQLYGLADGSGNIIIAPIYKKPVYIKSGKNQEIYTKNSETSKDDIIGSFLSVTSTNNPLACNPNEKQFDASGTLPSSASLNSNTNSSHNTNSVGDTPQTIVVEHHRDPVPVQEWQACFGCGGMGTMGCDNCGGSGTKYIGDRLHRCSRCNGRGIIPCNICYGNKGQYITVYR